MDTVQVILVDEQDRETGVAEKMQAHREGLLHRAFSIFIFNRRGDMLLQQRALEKYHSGGLWTNACCSHPLPGEQTPAAASRRLREELGIQTTLEKIFDFTYRSGLDQGLVEHEFDHVFAGFYDGDIPYDQTEVMAVCYKPVDTIRQELENDPEQFTTWFRIAFPAVQNWWMEQQGIQQR